MILRKISTALFLAVALPSVAADLPVQTQTFLSRVYSIDKKYRSMEGPGSIDQLYIGDPSHPELIWVTRIRTEMVGEDGKTPQLPELMCHVNVDVDSARHSALFNLKRSTATRLITLSQGMIDARFPLGFGYPLATNEPLSVYTQVLNLNIEHPQNLKVRHRVTFEYVRDRDLQQSMKPLFNVGASGTVILQDGGQTMPGMAAAMPAMAMAEVTGAGEHGVSCLIGARAPNAVSGGGSDYTDPQGRKLTGHWVVPPGKQVNHSDITWFMQLPVDTRLHWAAAHLHPFAKSLTVRDLTTGQTVFEVKAEGPKEGIGLSRVETFSSAAGVPMYRNHKYELISVYDNPTKESSDSMASAFLALADPEFVKPDSATLSSRASALLENGPDTTVIVRTSAGDLKLELLRNDSPNAVRNFIRLASAGVYDHAPITHSNELLTVSAAAAADARPATYVAERKAKHSPATLSTCGGSDFAVVMMVSAERDLKCTAFARVTSGIPALMSLGTGTQPAEIIRIDIYDSRQAATQASTDARSRTGGM